MIAQLTGTVLKAGATSCVLDVGGVGFLAHVTPSTAAALRPGEAATLHTSMVVREDSMTLFGFAEEGEREAFELAQTATGVGPKLALALMSGLDVDELVRCVQAQDTSVLVKIPGVGKKTAERLLVELKDRFKAWETLPGMSTLVIEPRPGVAVSSAETDALGALISLGYKPQEASRAVAAVLEDGLSSEELIRRALKGMV